MTCIIGLVHEGQVWMGADSAAVSGWSVRTSLIDKVFRNGQLLIGYTTSFYMGQLLRYQFQGPQDPAPEKEPLEYLIKQFVPEIRALFKEHGFAEIKDSQEKGGQFLVGLGGQLYTVDTDFQVQHYYDGFTAIGIGEDFALGALMALSGQQPPDRIYAGLRAAAYFNGAVTPPFQILNDQGWSKVTGELRV